MRGLISAMSVGTYLFVDLFKFILVQVKILIHTLAFFIVDILA